MNTPEIRNVRVSTPWAGYEGIKFGPVTVRRAPLNMGGAR